MFSIYVIIAVLMFPLSTLVFSLINRRMEVFIGREKEDLVGLCLLGSVFWPIALPLAIICLVILGLAVFSLWIQAKVDP